MLHATPQLDRLQLAGGLLDADGTIQALNPPCRRLLGWSPTACDAAIGQPFAALFESMSAPLAPEILKFVGDAGHWHGDLFFHDAHEAPLPIYLVLSGMSAAEADPTQPGQFVFFALDYAEQHFALGDQLRRQALLQRMWRDFPIGVIAVDGQGTVLQVNGAAKALWEKIGATVAEHDSLETVFATVDGPLQTAYEEALESRESRKLIDVPLAGPDGPVVHFEVNPQPRTGPLQFVLLFIEDRTQAIHMEARLRETERFASLGFMAANISHEINNPLQSLLGALEVLHSRCARLEIASEQQAQLDQATQRCLEDVARIAKIIRPIRDLAHTSTPQLVQQPVKELLGKIIESLQLHPRLADISFLVNAPGLGDIETDPGLVQQILTNLIINAAQAMEGHGTITLLAFADLSDIDTIHILIRDSGPGIEAKTAKQLFTPFYTTKQTGEGTGLGLYLSRAMALQLGGWLSLDPFDPPGACFRLTLPRRFAAAEDPDDRA